MNAPFRGFHSERPLHWAASSDDVDAVDALLNHGADIEAMGSVIDGGTPLANAVAFRQWRAARVLVSRGAQSTLWQAAALGLTDRLEKYFAPDPLPSPAAVTNALWHACNGGQLHAARFLLVRGADAQWLGHDGLTAVAAAARSGNAELIAWLHAQGTIAVNSS